MIKSSSFKKVFYKCVYHQYNLLQWMLTIPYDNWKTLFFTSTYRYPEVWCNLHVTTFFETSALKEVHILCPLSPQWHCITKIKLLLLKFSKQINLLIGFLFCFLIYLFIYFFISVCNFLNSPLAYSIMLTWWLGLFV